MTTCLARWPAVAAASFTPYTPTAGWTYYLEGSRGAWPACRDRFIASDSKDTKVGLASAADRSAEFTLEASNTRDGAFYLKLSSGRYMSYAGPCSNSVVDTWPEAGVNQEFRLVPTTNGTFSISHSLEAVGRAKSCPAAKTVTFGAGCKGSGLAMGAGGAEATSAFHLHAVRNNGKERYDKKPNSATGCADPFAWHSVTGRAFYLACTGGDLALLKSEKMSKDAVFGADGSALGGSIPHWAKSGNRWAPENLEVEPNKLQIMFFSDSAPDKHRVGWAMSEGAKPGGRLSSSWTTYSSAPLALGNAPGGEIDQHIFRDSAGNRTYLLWKTDDNSVGSKTTRLWGQEVRISGGGSGGAKAAVDLVGERKLLMDSGGLWWVDSWVDGGSLVEGPELVHDVESGWYYLFFAAGRYCQPSYAEGVARSRSVWGPYEKMPVPLLSTGLTQDTDGQKQVGPGHASYVSASGRYYAAYHASPGDNCNRHAFIEEMRFDKASGWPYIAFDSTD